MIDIREFTMQDYPAALDLWRRSEGVSVGASDARERIEAYLLRNPGLSFVAYDGDRLVGAVLCGHDGRRGYLNHLAVTRDRRRSGIGSRLASLCLNALKSCGISRCHLFVQKENTAAVAFWQRVGWRERVELVMMSHDLGL